MEGVTDAPMRKMLTQLGGYAFCVSEFVRISQNVPSPGAFRRAIPELKMGAKTASGTPVLVQILGGNPELMAQSALSAVKPGPQELTSTLVARHLP